MIGVVVVKLLPFAFRSIPNLSFPRVTRFSSRSARGRLMMGSEGQGAFNLSSFTVLGRPRRRPRCG
jgi:hypothetical protein